MWIYFLVENGLLYPSLWAYYIQIENGLQMCGRNPFPAAQIRGISSGVGRRLLQFCQEKTCQLVNDFLRNALAVVLEFRIRNRSCL